MLKVIAKFEAVVNEKVGHFLLDQDTPLNVAKEMCFQFIKFLGQIEDEVKRKQEEETKAKSEEKIEALNG